MLGDGHCVIGQVGSDIHHEHRVRDGIISSTQELFWCKIDHLLTVAEDGAWKSHRAM